MTLNSDSAANYSTHLLYGDGLNIGAGAVTSASSMNFERIADAGSPANVFGVIIIDILDYQNTNKYKTLRSLGGVDLNTNDQNSQIHLYSGNWRSTSAISTITLTAQAGSANFVQYTNMALYGIKG
jgi:hypothetical protein